MKKTTKVQIFFECVIIGCSLWTAVSNALVGNNTQIYVLCALVILGGIRGIMMLRTIDCLDRSNDWAFGKIMDHYGLSRKDRH